ncbi:hypothetical protein LPICM17_480057 [Lactococcus piscium]|nr:hypothetical protein LPICM17_480057 [Lactococcus piscium]
MQPFPLNVKRFIKKFLNYFKKTDETPYIKPVHKHFIFLI